MSFLKKTLLILFISAGILGPIFVFADAYGLETAGKTAGLADLAISKKNIPQLAGEIIGVGLSLVGIIFFLLMLYAGIRWMIAMGKSEDVQKAKDTLEAAAIGLVIVLSAYAITQFVFSNLGVGGGGGGSGGNQPQACVINEECAVGNCINGFCGGALVPQVPQDCFGCCQAECLASYPDNVDICKMECQICKRPNDALYSDAYNVCTMQCSGKRAEMAEEDGDCKGNLPVWCLDDRGCSEQLRTVCQANNGQPFPSRAACLLEMPECVVDVDCAAPYGACYKCNNKKCVKDPDIPCN